MESENEISESRRENVTSFGKLVFFCLLSIGTMLVATLHFTKAYGFALYIGVPALVGFVIGFLVQPRSFNKVQKVLGISLVATIVLSLLLLAVRVEGGICIIMIAGLLFLIILLGILVGRIVKKMNLVKNNAVIAAVLLINPFFIYVDSQQEMTENTVVSSTMINAPVDRLWRTLTDEVDFGKQGSLLFKLGVNYPRNMKLTERNDSLFLHCELRNGVTDLWVNVVEPKQKIRFQIIEHVIPIQELTIYDTLDTPHTHAEYFRLHFGEFRIEPVDEAHCRLIATSDFSFKLSPSIYWKWWSDYLVDEMHSRVITAVKEKAERH